MVRTLTITIGAPKKMYTYKNTITFYLKNTYFFNQLQVFFSMLEIYNEQVRIHPYLKQMNSCLTVLTVVQSPIYL